MPRRLAARDGHIGRDLALDRLDLHSDLFTVFRSFIAHIHRDIFFIIFGSHLVLIFAKDGCDMHGIVLVGHVNGDFLFSLLAVSRVDIDQFDIEQLEAFLGNNLQDDGHPRHIPDHIGVSLIRRLIYTISRFQLAVIRLMDKQRTQRHEIRPYLDVSGWHSELKLLCVVGTIVGESTAIECLLGCRPSAARVLGSVKDSIRQAIACIRFDSNFHTISL